MPRFQGTPVEQGSGPRFKGVPLEAPAAESNVGYVEDMARGGAAGVRQGIESSLGMFGDAANNTEGVARWLAEKFGASPELAGMLGKASRAFAGPFAMSPSSADLRSITEPMIGEPYKPQTVPGEYARTVGQFAPAVAAGPGNLPTRLITQVLLPALGSETGGQLTKGTKVEPYARIVGALAGAAAPSLLRRAVTPFPTSPERQQMADVLQKEGIDLTAGQKTGSQRLRYMESELGGLTGERMMESQGEQFTKAALAKAGINANRATPEVMDDAFRTIGQKFDDLAAQTSVPFDKTLQNDLLNAAMDYQSVAGTPAPVVERMVNRAGELAAQNGGSIGGEAYKNFRSELGRMIKKASPETKGALLDIQNAVDDAIQRNASGPLLDSWREARSQYRNMLVLEKAASGAGENTAMGIISPSKLRSAVTQQGKRAYVRGQGDFADLARAGEAVMKPLPQSGTAPRTVARNLGIGLSTLLGAGGGAAVTSTPAGAIAGMLAGAAAPAAAGRAMLSALGRAYLGNQLLGPGGGLGPNATRAIIASLLAAQNNRPAIAP